MSSQEITVTIGEISIEIGDVTVVVNNYSSPTGSTPTVLPAIEAAAPETTEPEPTTEPESTEAERIIKSETTEAERIIAPESTIEPERIVLAPTGDRVEPLAVAAISEMLYLSEENRRSRRQRIIVGLLAAIVALLVIICALLWDQHESQERQDKSIASIQKDVHGSAGTLQDIAGTLQKIQNDKPITVAWAPLYGARDKGHKDGYVALVQTSERAADGLEGAYGATIGQYEVVVTGPHTADGTINAYVQGKNDTHVVNLTADELNPNGDVKIFPIPLLPGESLVKVTVEHLQDGPIVLKP